METSIFQLLADYLSATPEVAKNGEVAAQVAFALGITVIVCALLIKVAPVFLGFMFMGCALAAVIAGTIAISRPGATKRTRLRGFFGLIVGLIGLGITAAVLKFLL